MIWEFSDGTTVALGGSIEGATLLAQQLRADIKDGMPGVSIWPPPGGSVPLDLNDAAIVDAWLRSELDFRTRLRGLKLTLKRPDGVPALPPPPWADSVSADAPGAVY